MSVYYALIILPVIILASLIFVFQSSLTGIQNEQFLQNCPMPLFKATASNIDINLDNGLVTFDVNYQNASNTATNTIFHCDLSGAGEPPFALNAIATTYSGTLINDQIAWVDYIGNSITASFDRAGHALTVIWLYFNAPAEVTQIPWFTFVNGVLLSFVGLGLFMAIRGSGG